MARVTVRNMAGKEVFSSDDINPNTMTLGALREQIAQKNEMSAGLAAVFSLVQGEQAFHNVALDSRFLKDIFIDQHDFIKLNIVMASEISNKCLQAMEALDIRAWKMPQQLQDLFGREQYIENPRFASIAVSKSGQFLSCCSEELKNDKSIVLAAVKNNGAALAYASAGLKADEEVVLEAIKNNGIALASAAETIKSNHEFILARVKEKGFVLQYASEELRSVWEIALAAVQQNGLALEHVADAFKADRVMVTEALGNDAEALEFAAPDLQNDKELVLKAVSKMGLALEHASPDLRADKEVVLKAIEQSAGALRFAHGDLASDREIFDKAHEKDSTVLRDVVSAARIDRRIRTAAIAAVIIGAANNEDENREEDNTWFARLLLFTTKYSSLLVNRIGDLIGSILKVGQDVVSWFRPSPPEGGGDLAEAVPLVAAAAAGAPLRVELEAENPAEEAGVEPGDCQNFLPRFTMIGLGAFGISLNAVVPTTFRFRGQQQQNNLNLPEP